MIVPVGRVGSPTVVTEKPPGKAEQVAVFEAFESYLGQQPYATMCIEAGGMNSTVPIAIAAELGLPLVDADGMGRVFPKLQVDDGAEIILEFQNEYLVARHSTTGIIASVPDLIVVCDAETADPIPVEELTYGSQVR